MWRLAPLKYFSPYLQKNPAVVKGFCSQTCHKNNKYFLQVFLIFLEWVYTNFWRAWLVCQTIWLGL